ncbi:hypothetical protein [Eubacterium sp.]
MMGNNVMSEFKFVCREEELNFAKEALINKNFIIYYYFNDSGLTHYLKKLTLDLNTEKVLCFYIDCTHIHSIAIQIATQIISSSDKKKISTYIKDERAVVKNIINSLATSIDVGSIIPFVDVGELISGLTNAIRITIDADMEHISDYKIEKAIIHMLKKIEKKSKINKVVFLLDDISSLRPESLDFLGKIMDFNMVSILATMPNNHFTIGTENLSKICSNTFEPFQIDRVFERPNNRMIKGLFKCYNRKFEEKYLNIFDRYERNIHVIMSYIRGFNMDFINLDKQTIYILKIMLILDSSIEYKILYDIYSKNIHINSATVKPDFQSIVNTLMNHNFLARDQENFIHLNNNIITEQEIKISLVDKLTISRDIVDVFEKYKYELTIPQLKFAINNLDKDYNRRKSYILLLLRKEKMFGYVEQQYLDMLFYLDNKTDLIEICSMYYDLQVYDVPFLRIQQHTNFIKERECQDLIALLQERLHINNYCDKLWDQIHSSTNIDEKCLLMAVTFTALFNNGENDECKKILNDADYKYYYKKFISSRYYHFLLRNVSYYMEDVEEGIHNYTYCLTKFKNSDPVNYNRTLSNFIGYLMKQIDSDIASNMLRTKINEAKSILEFNDIKYLYLNINYGIYLMLETNDDPTPYFDSILYNSGTTETPYIYARINEALYIAKKAPSKALNCFDEIFYTLICDSNVVPTKIFYKINRLFVEYMNNINNEKLLEEIKSSPLRGDENFTNKLYSFYSYRFKNKIKYRASDWKKCILPGYIFYHGFDAELLTSSLSMPSFKI